MAISGIDCRVLSIIAVLRLGVLILAAILSGTGAAIAAGGAPAAASGRITGTVRDALGKPIAGATVSVAVSQTVVARTKTDRAGKFVAKVPGAGIYAVSAEQPQFKPAVKVVVLSGRQTAASVVLTMATGAPLTLEVMTSRLDRARNALSPETGSSAYRFDEAAVERLPQGENTQLAQVIAQAPGVSQDAYGQGQEQVHFHGENGGGIQYRINGVFLPEAVSSFGEIFSSRFARSITLLTGVLPAQFGFRNEGIIDIQTKDGCLDRGASADFFGGQRATIEPSFEFSGCKGNFSYYVSGFYLQSDLGLQSPTPSPTPAHDHTNQGQGFAYLSYFLGPQTRLSLIAGTAVNYFQIPPEPGLAPVYDLEGVTNYPSAAVKESELEQSHYGILTLDGALGDRAAYQLSAFSRYYTLDYDPDPIGDLIYDGVAAKIFHSGFINGLQEDTSYTLDPKNTIHAGFYVSGETIEIDDHAMTFPAKDGNQTSNTPFAIVDDNHEIAWLLGFYAQDEWQPVVGLTINAGARWDWMNAFVTQNQFSPRVGFEYEVRPGTIFHGGYARYFKVPPFESVALETVQKFANTTNAAPVSNGNDKIPAERDDYFDVGIRQRVIEGLNVGIDGFYKQGHDQLDLAQLAGSQVFAPLSYSQSRAWGSDFSATYQRGAFSSYFNFSYAVLQAKNIDAGQFLADDADEIGYIAKHWVTLDDNQMFTASAGSSYWLRGFLLTLDGLWGSGYRRGFANSGELPPSLQFNLAVVRNFQMPGVGRMQGRVAILNLFDHSYLIRNGTGIGVFSPQYGPRRAVYAGITVPLGSPARQSPP
jgi:TonB-dependent receptor-like protein/carboxypeptidase family protein